MAKDEKNKRRFYRAKLPMVVWDPRHDCALCDFVEGHIITDDEYTIKRLLEIGYPEIALDAERPPEIVEPIQAAGMPDIRPLPAGMTEKGAASIPEKKEPVPAASAAPSSPAGGTGAPAGAKNTPSSKPKKSPAKKGIKRRPKK